MTVQQRRTTPGLTSALILIVLILIGVLYGGRLKDNVATLDATKVLKETELAKVNEEFNFLDKLAKSLPDTEVGKMKLLEAVPTDLKQDELIKDIDKLTKESNISFDSINFDVASTEPVAGGVSKVRIYSTFKGTYDDLLRFLQAVEKSKRKISVRSISLTLQELVETAETKDEKKPVTPETAVKFPLMVSFNLNMEAYYQGLIK